MEDIIKNAIIRANKLGLKGVKVTGYIEPISATQSPELALITTTTEPQTASDDSD
jgi:hypothetical protein